MKLSDKINKILLEQNLNQSQLSRVTGVNVSVVYNITRGDTKTMSNKTAYKINAKFPEYSYAWLKSEEIGFDIAQTNKQTVTLTKNGVAFSKEEVAYHVATNEEEYMKIKVFSNVVEKKVVERILKIIKRGGFKEFLNN